MKDSNEELLEIPCSLGHCLVEKLLCLVYLARQVRAATTIRVIEKHQCAVRLANLLLSQARFAVVYPWLASCTEGNRMEVGEGICTSETESTPLPACSCAVRTRLCRRLARGHQRRRVSDARQ